MVMREKFIPCLLLLLSVLLGVFWVVEVTGKSFQTHLSKVLPVMRNILHSAVNAPSSSQQELSGSNDAVPFWKEAYYSLVMLEKILSQFHYMFLDKELEDIWDTICEFLLHRHLWLQTISSRITSAYFAAFASVCSNNSKFEAETFHLIKPSILFHIAVSSCCQLKVPSSDRYMWHHHHAKPCVLHSLSEKKRKTWMFLVSGPASTVLSKTASLKHLVFLIQEKGRGPLNLLFLVPVVNMIDISIHLFPICSRERGRLPFRRRLIR